MPGVCSAIQEAHDTRHDLLTLTQQAVLNASAHNSTKVHIHSVCFFHKTLTFNLCAQAFAASFLLLLPPWKDNSACLASCCSAGEHLPPARSYKSAGCSPSRWLSAVAEGSVCSPAHQRESGTSGWAAAYAWCHVCIPFSCSPGTRRGQGSRAAGTRWGPCSITPLEPSFFFLQQAVRSCYT